MTGLTIDGGELTITPNGFSTTNRHIRETADPADAVMWMVEGPSIAIVTQGNSISWRLEIGPYVVVGDNPNVTANPAAGFNTPRGIAL